MTPGADREVEYLTAQWHEARAADLLRPEHARDGTRERLPLPRAVDTAAAHIALAQSLRVAALTRTLAAGMTGITQQLRRRP